MATVTIQGLTELISAFQQAQVDLPDQLNRAMVASVVGIKQTAQELVPVNTGALRTSITEMVSGSPPVGTVSVGQPYGVYMEYGTRPHVIMPVNAKALRFISGGQVVFAKMVNHPGTAPRPFMGPALEQNLSTIQDNFQRAIASIVSQLGGK